jgi:MYXO-CTERM domain-containing protein
MRPLSFAAVLLFVTGGLHAQTLGPVDWIFLVDTSKSMRGIGGTKDIWPDVKASLDSFVDETSDGDTVAIYAFDRGVRLQSATKVDAATRADLHTTIRDLQAEGDRTHLGAAIAQGLERAELLRPKADATRSRVVVLFTDGKEDTRGIQPSVAIEANVDRVADTFLFLVSMGAHEPQLDAFAAKTPRTTVLRAPTAEAIRNVARDVRLKIPKPPPPPPVVHPKPKPVPPPPPPPSPWLQALKAVAALALLALIAFLVLRQRRKQNRLEGELEILRPPAAPDAAFVGLPSLQANEVALSAILPAGTLAGSDARLFVRRKAGRKRVWIAAQSGSLRINDVETPMSELYDADTIDIGEARLRFNRVGDERPFESNQEGDL